MSNRVLVVRFSGRSDLAHVPFLATVEEFVRQGSPRYNPHRPVERVQLNEFVVRFAAEVSRDAGPPFHTCLIGPGNRIERIRNDSFSPVDAYEVRRRLMRLGVRIDK